MVAGARDIGMSPSIVGSFSRKEAELVEVFSRFLIFFTFPIYILDYPFNSVMYITKLLGTAVNMHEVLTLDY